MIYLLAKTKIQLSKLRFFWILFLIMSLGSQSWAQQDSGKNGKKTDTGKISITAREILQRVDLAMHWKMPYIKSKMTFVHPSGDIRLYQVEIYNKDNHYLYVFKSMIKGEVERVLYRFSGEKIWVFNVLTKILYHKQGIDKFRSILHTDFFYFDLSGARFQANYTARILGRVSYKKRMNFKLELYPLYRSAVYGMLTLWVDEKSFIPLRIDYHDIDRVVFKTLKVVRIIEEPKTGKVIPDKMDMLNIERGTFTTMENVLYDPKKKLDDKLFLHDTLNK